MGKPQFDFFGNDHRQVSRSKANSALPKHCVEMRSGYLHCVPMPSDFMIGELD